MLHVRVVSPAALAEQRAGRLATAPGVQNYAPSFSVLLAAAALIGAVCDLAQAAALTAVTFSG